MSDPRHWTKEEDEQLKKLFLDSNAYTHAEIAEKLGSSYSSVEKRKGRLIMKFTQKEKELYTKLRREGSTSAQKKANLKWTPVMIKKLRLSAESGLFESLSSLRNSIFPEETTGNLRAVLSNNKLSFFSSKREHHDTFDTVSMDGTTVKTSPAEFWKTMEENSKEEIVLFKRESFHSILFDRLAYIGITCIGDQHFGKLGIDYERAREDATVIKNTPNMYVLFGGDFFENYLKANIMEALVNKESSPKQERMLLEHYFTFFGDTNEAIADKIIASVSGNHDWRTSDVSGIDLIKMMLKGKRILYSPEELRLTLNVNGIEYKIGARHQSRFNSTLNYCHTVKRWYDEGDETFDVGIIWHNHKPDIEEFIKHNQMRLGVRPGSYKIKDRWAKAKGYPITMPLMPTIVFNPFEKTMVVFKHVHEASEYLKLKNGTLIK